MSNWINNEDCLVAGTRWLITVASWEERFLLGTRRLCEEHRISKAFILYYEEYIDWTADNLRQSLDALRDTGAHCASVEISFNDPVRSWHVLHNNIMDQPISSYALVDCTTMPRDTLWTSLELLRQRGIATDYVYHQPQSYDSKWLSRDPGRPTLVYQLSGIATLGRPMCLLIVTGFDPERTRQLMWHYEPRVILLGFQKRQAVWQSSSKCRTS